MAEPWRGPDEWTEEIDEDPGFRDASIRAAFRAAMEQVRERCAVECSVPTTPVLDELEHRLATDPVGTLGRGVDAPSAMRGAVVLLGLLGERIRALDLDTGEVRP